MARPEAARRLIVNADDFGRSASINAAVIRAHREGILTSASLMVGGEAAEEAVELARENPALGVGLHLTLVCGRATSRAAEIPGLVDKRGHFSNNSVATGLKYFFRRKLRTQLRTETTAQFTKFHQTGLKLDHLNGHLHLHLHPVIFNLLMAATPDFGFQHVRLVRDPFWQNVRLSHGRWVYRATHALIYSWLSRRAGRVLAARGLRHTDRVFGLLQNARVDENYVAKLLPVLPPGDSELYSHPSLDEFRHEFDALVSPRVKALAASLGIQLIRYQDL